MRTLYFTLALLCLLTPRFYTGDEVNTVNFQGFLQAGDTGAPINGTYSMRFIIHQSGSSPLDEVPEILWEGVREKVNVKDGIYSVRLGEFPDLPITKEIFVISNLELTIEIVRFGTNDSPSYLSGISIDSNPYSVSSVSKKGEDEKQGTLTIVPDTTPRKDEIGLLELRDPNKESLTHELKIEGEGTGLVISFPNEMRLVDHSGTDSGLPDPVKGDDLAPDGTAMDIAVYIKNGAVILGEGLDILPLKLLDGENQEFPLDENGSAYIDSVNASVGQEMRVNKLEVGGPVVGKGTAGVILGKKLEYCKGPPNCPDDPNFKDYGIDPFPAEGESHLTQINSLEIGVKSGQAGELLLEGPEGSTNTANIEVTGKNSYIFAPEIRSPYKVKGQKGLEANPYVIAPAETTVLHSLILATDTLENRDPQYPAHRESVTTRDALKSRLNADAAFDLVSTIPVCSNQAALGPFSENCSETWCMALRADYCDTSEGNGDKDPYADIDPCHGIPGNRLKGYKLNCTSDIFSDHPNLETDPNSPSDGKKFFATNHIHSLLKNADAATLIDIINASTSDQFIKKQLLPTDTVNLDFANTLTGINIFEEVHAAHRVIASMENKIDAFLGTHILKASQPAEIGSLNPQVGQIDFIREGSGESFLNLHSGDAQFKASNLEGRVQRHSVKEDLIIQREAVIYQSPTQVGGQLEFQDSDSDASNGPFFYIPGETIVSGDIRFTTGAQATNRNILGISEISASLYGDNDAAGFFLDPSSSSILSDLEVTGSLKVSGPVTLAQGLYLDQGFFARNYLLADGVLEAKIYADLDNPAFKVEADQVSSLQGLSVQEDLIVSGDLSINSSLTLTGSLQISGNLSSVGDLYIQSPGSSLQAKSLLALNNPTYQLDPSGSSLMRTLQLIPPSNSDGGNLTVGKKMTLSGGITHGGDARISGPINSDEEISTRSIIDFEDPSYVIDPDKDSRLHELTLTNSLEVSQSLSVSDGLTIGADVVANASLEGKTTLDIGQSLIFESGLELRNTTGPVFTVDNTGHILGRAITLENNAFAQDLEIGGGLQLSGPTIEFNANVAMNELKISTHSLIALRSLNPGEVETAARFDANGNLYVHEDMNFQEELSFSSTVTLSSNLSGNEIILSENSGLVSTAVIGDLGSKSLVISGLSAQRLKSTSLEFSLFVDRDDSSFQIDPSSSSLIQDLQISSSLETENTLSSPYLLDLQNQIVVDPSAESELESLEVLSPVTAQMIQLSQLTILSSSQPVGTTLIDAGSFKITREEQIHFSGTSHLTSSSLKIENSTGILIANDFSSGTGILMTPGDLSTLITGQNADNLHRHDVLGGVAVYNLARLDIDNTVVESPETTSALKGLHGKQVFTTPGQALAIHPEKDSQNRPIFAILNSGGSQEFSVFSSGAVHAKVFRGKASGISNISGSGTTHDAITDGSILKDKIRTDSLTSKHFNTGALETRHLMDASILGRHFKEASLSEGSLLNGSVLGNDLNDQVLFTTHIQDLQVGGQQLKNGSIQAYHLETGTLSGQKVQAATLTGRAFEHQAIDSSKILDNSVHYQHVSTATLDSARIIDESLLGSVFEDLSISRQKIQTDAIQTSLFRSLTLTHSDFADSSVTSVTILTEGVQGQSFQTATLKPRSLAINSVDHQKISSNSIFAVDIANSSILPSPESSQHKIQRRSIISPKVLDRSVQGEHFLGEKILLSHVASDSLSSLQIADLSINNQDLASFTLSGDKIADFSITTTQIANEAILSEKMADNIFDANAIAAVTLSSRAFGDASILRSNLASNSILTTHIRNLTLEDFDFQIDALVQSKWQTNTVSSTRISSLAVTLDKFSTGAVSSIKIAQGAITTSSIQAGAILSDNLRQNQVISSKIQDLTVLTEDIDSGQISERIVAPQSLYTTQILDLSIDASLIPSLTLDSTKIAPSSITEWKIASGQISSEKIKPYSLTDTDLATHSILPQHIDTLVLSSATLASSQILTTHIRDGAIINAKITDLELDSRILVNGSIATSHILSLTLLTSDFSSAVLSDPHFQAGSITDTHIQTLSLSGDPWSSYAIESRHVLPQVITSSSLADGIITSAQIALSTVSGNHIQDLRLTDLDLASDALPGSVFDQNSISSPMIVDLSLESQDFATGSLLTTHLGEREIQSNDFVPASVLTTHIHPFTLGSNAFASASITTEKLKTRSALTRGFTSLSDTANLSDILRLHSLDNGPTLLISNLAGIFEIPSLNQNFLKLNESLTGGVNQILSHQSRVWIVQGSKLFMSAYSGEGFQLLQSFNSPIGNLYFEDNRHGVLTTETENYLSYDGGFSFRKVRTGSAFKKVFSLEELGKIWIIANDGTLAFSTDALNTTSALALPSGLSPLSSNFNFRMLDQNTGYILDNATIYKTTSNWATVDQTAIAGNFLLGTIDNSGSSVVLKTDGSLESFTPDLAQTSQSFSGFSDPAILVADVSFQTTSTWTLLYKHSGESDDYLAKTMDGGNSYAVASLGVQDFAASRYTRLEAFDSQNIYLTRGHQALHSSDGGDSFQSLALTPPLSFISSIYFTSSQTGFASFHGGGEQAVYQTINGGNSWSKTNLSLTTYHFLAMQDGNKGWALGLGTGSLLGTLNAFGSVTNYNFPGSQLKDLKILGNTLYFSGNGGLIGQSSDPSAVPATTIVSSSYSFSAIAPDGNSGIFLGSSSGKVFHLTSFNGDPIELNYGSGGDSIWDLCSRNETEILAVGRGENTQISYDGGTTWNKVLDGAYDNVLFTSCYWNNSDALILGTGGQGYLVSRLGQGIESRRILASSIDSSDLDADLGASLLTQASFSGAKLGPDSLLASKFQTATLIAAKLASDATTSGTIREDAVINRVFQDYSITREKIASQAIDGSSKVANDVLTGGDFSDLGSIDYEIILSDTLGALPFTQSSGSRLIDADFSALAIQNPHLQRKTIPGTLFSDQALQSKMIASNSVEGAQFQSNTLGTSEIQDASISLERLLPSAVSGSMLQSASIQSSHLASAEFWNSRIPDGEIDSASLDANSFHGNRLKGRVLEGNLISDNTVTYDSVLNESIELHQIQTESISAIHFVSKSILLDKIETGALDATAIASASVKGEFAVSGDLLSSKIDSQAISGISLELNTLGTNHLITSGFNGDEIKATTLTQSKIATRTLTDAHFSNLESGAFSTGSADEKQIRLLQFSATHAIINRAYQGAETLGIHGLSGDLLAPRFSHDGSKLVFINSSKIYFSDAEFERVVDTGLNYPGTPDAFFTWKPDNSGFYYFNETDDWIYFYDLHNRSATQDTNLGQNGGSKLVFSEDRTRFAILSGNTVTASDSNCATGNTGIEDLTITPDGARLLGTSSTGNEIKVCVFGSGAWVSKDYGQNARFPRVNPRDSTRFYYFLGTSLSSTGFSDLNTYTTHLNPSLTTNANLEYSSVFPSHVLRDQILSGSLFVSGSVYNSHIASLSIPSEGFSGKVLTSSHFQSSSVSAVHIQATTLTGSVLDSGVITSGHLESLTLEGQLFTSESIPSERIEAGSLHADRLEDYSILTSHLQTTIIDSSKIAEASLLTTHILDDSANNSDFIAASILTESHLKTSEVSSFSVSDTAILSAHIQSQIILPGQLEVGAILEEHIQTSVLNSTHFATGVLIPEKIGNSEFQTGDGFIISIENGNIYRYNWDGSNPVLLQSGGWSDLQRDARGNSLTAVKSTTSWEIDPFASSLKRRIDIPGSQTTMRDRLSDTSYAIGGDHWKSLTPIPGGKRRSMGADIIRGRIYIAGGHDGSPMDRLEVYDPSHDNWETKSPMSDARRAVAGAAVNGVFYVFGGHDGSYLDRVEAYDPATDTWTTKTPMPGGGRRELRAEAVNGKIYVIGGYRGPSLDIVEEYDPATDTWATKTPMPGGGREDHETSVVNGKIYVFGGYSSCSAQERVEEYDPATDSWATKASILGGPLREMGATSLNSKVYLFGGYDGSNIKNTVLEYDPAADSWRSHASLGPGNWMEMSPVAYNDAIYLFGGNSGAGGPQVSWAYRYFTGESDHLLKISDSVSHSKVDSGVVSNGMDFFASTSKLVYVTESGPFHYLTETNGSTNTVLYTTSTTVMSPKYNRSGSEVYFVHDQGSPYSILKWNGSVSLVYTTDQAIFSLRPSTEDDGVFFLMNSPSGKNLYHLNENGTVTQRLDALSDIDSFDILPYSAFDEQTLVSHLGPSTITTSIWASRVLSSANLAASTLGSTDLAQTDFTGDIFQNSSFTQARFLTSTQVTVSLIASKAITSGSVTDGSIQTAHIQDATITSRSFSSSTLTSSRLTGLINATRIQDLALGGAHFQVGAVPGTSLQTASITQDKIVSNSLTSIEVLDLSLIGDDFGSASLDASVFASREITGGHIQASQITSALVQTQNLSGSVLADNALTYGHIQIGAVTTALVKDGDIPGSILDNRSLVNDSLTPGAITSSLLSNLSIYGTNFGSNLTTSSLLQKGLTGSDFLNHSFSRERFEAETLTDTEITTNSITSALIGTGALGAALVANDSINGASLKEATLTSAQLSLLSFDSAHFNDVFTTRTLASLSLTNTDFTTIAGDRLTLLDFETEVADLRTVADGTITTGKLSLSSILTSTGNGLRLTDSQILGTHFKPSSLTSRLLATGAIGTNQLEPSSLSTSRIDIKTIPGTKMNDLTLQSADLEDGAILQGHIPEQEILSADITDSSFKEENISQISGDEISNLTGSKIKSGAITGGDLSGSLTSREISQIAAENISDLTFGSSAFSSDAVTRGHFTTGTPLQMVAFLGSEIPSSRIKPDSLAFTKMNTSDTPLLTLFEGGDADSLHSHEILSQEIQCPTGYVSVNGGGATTKEQNSFCQASSDLSDTLTGARNQANSLNLSGTSVRGQICNFEQNWKAVKDGITLSQNLITSSFFLQPKGFGASLQVVQLGTLTASGTGTPNSTEASSSITYGGRVCF